MAFLVSLAMQTTHNVQSRISADKTLPKGTIVFHEYVAQDGIAGEAAMLPNGKWLFRPANSSTFQEVRP